MVSAVLSGMEVEWGRGRVGKGCNGADPRPDQPIAAHRAAGALSGARGQMFPYHRKTSNSLISSTGYSSGFFSTTAS